MSFVDYRVLQGDTLERIAANELGNANNWRVLAYVNRLRMPFISDRPLDQYGGHPSQSGSTLAGITAGATTYMLPLPVSSTTFQSGMVFYVDRPDATQSSGYVFDALVLQSDINETSGLMTFTSAFQHDYPVGAGWYLFYPNSEVSTRVLKTGDLLHLPADNFGLVGAVGARAFVGLLGIDIALDVQGGITFDTNGALNTVAGVDNLRQALAIRLNTPYGSVPAHRTYGNRLFEFVGQQQNGYFQNLVRGLVTSALAADPRVEQVTSLTISVSNTAVSVDAQVKPRNGSGLVRADNLVVGL